jgi:uncharacterized protein YjiS (DUF1127 family)
MRNAAYFIASQGADAQAGTLQSVLHGVLQAIRSFSSRRAVAKLADLDEHLLADIGLDRSDVKAALDLPFSHDVSRELQFRASRNVRRGWNA